MEERTPTDGEAIEAVLAGQRDAFRHLVARYQQALRRVAVSQLGRSDWADDVVQETFLCCYRSLHAYDSRYSFRTWLWTILLNQCRRRYRIAKRRERWSDRRNEPSGAATHNDQSLAVARDSQSEPPEQALLHKEQQALLERLLRGLPQPQAEAIRLRFYGGCTFAEIAAASDCSLSAAKHRVRVGLLKLAAGLRRSGFEQAGESCETRYSRRDDHEEQDA